MKILVLSVMLSLAVTSAFADTTPKKMTSYDFSIVRKSVSAGESFFYDITYTPHKSITPIHVYIIAKEAVELTEDQLASTFEFLSEESFFSDTKEAFTAIGLPESRYEIISKRRGVKDNFIFLRQK